MANPVKAYTDGSSTGSVGGWSYVLTNNKDKILVSGNEHGTTSNAMELTAVIKALEALPSNRSVQIYSDSRYVVDGINNNLLQWASTDETAALTMIKKKLLKNFDLWKRLFQLIRNRKIVAKWIKGHNGHPLNEMVNSSALMSNRLWGC